MKKLMTILMALLVIVSAVYTAQAESPSNIGFVASTTCTIRATPASNAKSVQKLKNGDYVVIFGTEYNAQQDESFYKVISRESWEKGNREIQGYVVTDYIKEGLKKWVTLPTGRKLRAGPGSKVAVGERSTNNTMVILDEFQIYDGANYKYWWALQMQDSVGGAGYIQKNLVSEPWTRPEDEAFAQAVLGGIVPSATQQTQQQSQQQTGVPSSNTSVNGLYNGCKALVNCDTLAVKNEPDDNVKSLGFLHKDDIVQVKEVGEYYSSIYYNYKEGIVVIAYVHTEHLLGIAN